MLINTRPCPDILKSLSPSSPKQTEYKFIQLVKSEGFSCQWRFSANESFSYIVIQALCPALHFKLLVGSVGKTLVFEKC